jgi:hypothetical protein
MTLDLSVAPADLGATVRRQVVTYTGPVLYATGGDAVTPNDVRMGKIFAVLGLTITNGTLTYIGWFDAENLKIMWFDMAGAQVGAVDLSTFTGRLEFVGV